MATMDVGETMVWVVQHTVRTCVRGMALAVTAVVWLPLFFASLVCVLLLPTGLGVVLAPKSLLAVRRQAERQRRWALEWSGVTIAAPYRSRSAKPTNRLVRVFRRCGWVLGDPATWRDLLWTLVNVPVSVVLGLLPAFMLVAFTWTVVDDYGTVVHGWGGVAPHGFLLQVFLLSMLPACAIAGPWLLKIRARRLVVAAGADPEGDGGEGGPADRVPLGRGGRVGGRTAPDRTRPARRSAGPAGRPRHEHRLRRADGQGQSRTWR